MTDRSITRDERRRAILDAATRVFARTGFDRCRVGDIAAEAGVSHGLLYHYFGSKDEVLQTVIEERWGRLLAALGEIEQGDAPADEKLRLAVAVIVRAWLHDPDAVRVLVREVGRGPQLQARVEDLRGAFDAIRRILEEGQQQGLVRPELSARLAAWVVYGAVEEILTGWALGQLPDTPDDVARAERALVAVLCGGLLTRAAASV